jgi:hypothetical protein
VSWQRKCSPLHPSNTIYSQAAPFWQMHDVCLRKWNGARIVDPLLSCIKFFDNRLINWHFTAIRLYLAFNRKADISFQLELFGATMITSQPNTISQGENLNEDQTAGLSAATRKELANACLAHAQLMIATAMIQFIAIIMMSLDFTEEFFDFYPSQVAYNNSTFVLSLASVALLAIFALSTWIFITSGFYKKSALMRQYPYIFWPKGAAGIWAYVALGLLLVLMVSGIVAIGWMQHEKLIPNGMGKVSQIFFTLTFMVGALIFAVMRIRQAIKLTL